MLKICRTTTFRPLKLILQPYLEKRLFSSESRYGNKDSICKEGDKQSEKNYRSASLLSDWEIKYSNSYCFIKWTGFFTENDLALLN